MLLNEVFGDMEGEGRPVTTIDADDALLSRTLARDDCHLSNQEAFDLFRASFPPRWQVLRWFSGVDAPGEALVAFLVLCCLAASDIVEADKEDYRRRLQAMMDWDQPVTDCSALPGLWSKLTTALERADRGKWRPLVLPDPGFRTQIGHAIELTFPSRRDTRRLRQELDAGGLFDPHHPVAVLRWLGPRVVNYSSSFATTFAEFQAAWLAGDRALIDHRFWTGWCKAIDAGRAERSAIAFEIHCDEWGRHELISVAGEAATLDKLSRDARIASALRSAISVGAPIFLREADWGRWTWCGEGKPASNEAAAALFREKSYSPALRTQLMPSPVAGADGWSFTSCLHLLSMRSPRDAFGEDDLIDARLSGSPRVDGGWLARPSFPIRISTRGLVSDVALHGEASEHLRLEKVGPANWLVRALRPVEGQAKVLIAPGVEGRASVVRHIALRRTTIAPELDRITPARYAQDEPPTSEWSATFEGDTKRAFPVEFERGEGGPGPSQGLFDLVEYFAARPTPMPLGGLCELVAGLGTPTFGAPWSIIRSLMEGGLLDPLRMRGGWRGGAVAPRSPRGILARVDQDYRLTMDGLVNEACFERTGNVAEHYRTKLHVQHGPSAWSVPTISIDGELSALMAIAAELALPLSQLSPDLFGLPTPQLVRHNANADAHPQRQKLNSELGRRLEARGVSLFHCRREKDDGPRLWLVVTSQGEERAWLQRHLAVLDAYVAAGLPAFSLSADRASMTAPEALLPLELARWLRVAAGRSSGPVGLLHTYPTTAPIVRPLQGYLGALLGQVPQTAGPSVGPRRTAGGALAVSGGDEIGTRQVWRWARERKGATT